MYYLKRMRLEKNPRKAIRKLDVRVKKARRKKKKI